MRFALLLLLALPIFALGQNGDNLFITGFTYTKDGTVENAASKVDIEIKQGKNTFLEVVSNENGEFQAGLSLGHVYSIQVSKKGYYSKTVLIDLTEISDEDAEGGFSMKLTFSMVPDTNKKDRKLLKKHPIGKCSYNENTNSLEFDFEYTKSITSKLHH